MFLGAKGQDRSPRRLNGFQGKQFRSVSQTSYGPASYLRGYAVSPQVVAVGYVHNGSARSSSPSLGKQTQLAFKSANRAEPTLDTSTYLTYMRKRRLARQSYRSRALHRARSSMFGPLSSSPAQARWVDEVRSETGDNDTFGDGILRLQILLLTDFSDRPSGKVTHRLALFAFFAYPPVARVEAGVEVEVEVECEYGRWWGRGRKQF
jgi:hypothetical protein